MAGTSVVVDLLLRARDLASAPLRAVTASIKLLDSEISVVAGKIRESFSDIFGGGLTGAADFEAQLDKVAAKGGYTAEEMEVLKKAATDIGTQFGVTGTEAAQGMEALAAAGLNATQTMQALPAVLALAKAEGISMDAAAEKLSDSLSIVGLGFEEAGRMADVLAKGANVSTTSASALAQALSTAGGIAKTAGMDLEQTVGAMSALANAGIKGEQAGTSLAAMLTQLTNPASAASKELSALGITSRDLGTVIAELAAKGDASNAAILAFGETAGPGLRALIGQGQQKVSELTAQLYDSEGAAQAAADAITGNLNGALSALTSAWENVKAALFEPVLEPLAQSAKDAATALNTSLNNGALKPTQEAIRAFATNSIQAARDFVSGFDFGSALASVQSFAKGASESFSGIASSAKTASDIVTIAWNAVTAGFRTIGSSLLAVAASAVQTLANMEEVASKIGLGTQQRANELRETANNLQAKSTELINQVGNDGREMQAAFDRLTSSVGDAAAANEQLADSLPAAELETINRSLADYADIAQRASDAAAQAQKDFFENKITLDQLAEAADASKAANDDLAAAQARAAEASKAGGDASGKAAEQHQKTATELEAVATSSQEAADRQAKYTSAVDQAGSAQAKALQAEINLALARGDTVTATAKSIELAQAEAAASARVAASKQKEAESMQQAVTAQQAYLASVGGGTAAQQQDLQILQLKLVALQSEAKETAASAEEKKIAAQQLVSYTQAQDEHTNAIRRGVDAAKEGADATKKQAQSFTLMEDAAIGSLRQLSAISAGMNQLVSSMMHVDDIGKYFGHQWRGELGKLQLQLQQVNAAIQHNNSIVGTNADAYERNANIANTARKMWLEQSIAATTLAGSLKDASEGANVSSDALQHLVSQAERSANSMDLLDQQTLDKLKSEIDAANQKLQHMQEEAQSAKDEIARLNAEIASEQGDTEKAALLKQQLDYQQALAQIEANRAKAEADGNRELIALYEEQARKLSELNALKEKNIKADADAAKQQSSNTSTTSTSSTSSSSGGASTTANNNITINVDGKDLLSEDQVRNKILPVLNRTLRLRS